MGAVSSIGFAQERNYTFGVALAVGSERALDQPPSTKPVGGCFAGLSAGVERRFATQLSLRGSATFALPCWKGDDIALSVIAPPGSPYECYPNLGYAGRYGIFALTGHVRPMRSIPVGLLAGGGWTAISKAGGPTPVPSSCALWQWGGSIDLGRSRRAPRIELTETRFGSPVGYIDRLVGVQFWLRV